ncbi:hypothetical protein C8F04DRAFT_1189994 [Mycena alexandri]|uniref:Uncharacterized protein n=1 Tax=Mycena alexandri TaxID=1745969 RepID=A0AAD6SK55_9AGAR|nr:hypothetical protein C8F04DRAFT_1189994 [Mycena alexandri]
MAVYPIVYVGRWRVRLLGAERNEYFTWFNSMREPTRNRRAQDIKWVVIGGDARISSYVKWGRLPKRVKPQRESRYTSPTSAQGFDSTRYWSRASLCRSCFELKALVSYKGFWPRPLGGPVKLLPKVFRPSARFWPQNPFFGRVSASKIQIRPRKIAFSPSRNDFSLAENARQKHRLSAQLGESFGVQPSKTQIADKVLKIWAPKT